MSEIVERIDKQGESGTDIWDNLDSPLWNNMTVYNNRLSSGYVAKYAVVDNTVYVYIHFYGIDKTKFGSGFDYWTIFQGAENPNLPINARTTPLIVADKQGVFTSAIVENINIPQATGINICLLGNAQNYDNSKGQYYSTVIQGQYQIK